MTLSVLFFLLALLTLLLLIWGLIFPRKAFLGTAASRGKIGKVYGLAFVALMAGTLVTAPAQDAQQPSSTPAPPENEPAAAAGEDSNMPEKAKDPAKTLAMTPAEFRDRYNAVVETVDAQYSITDIVVQDGPVNDAFNSRLAGNVSVIGAIDKESREITGLTVILAGGEETDVARPVLAILAVSQVANPGAPKEEVAKEVMAITQAAMEDLETGSSHRRTVGSVTYAASANKLTGLMLSISPQD